MGGKNQPQAPPGAGWYKEQQLLAQSQELARRASAPISPSQRAVAEENWAKVKHQPLMALAVLVGLSALGGSFCLGGGLLGYVGIGVFALILIWAVVGLNQRQRTAFVDMQMARGMTRDEAERDYKIKYGD